MAVCVDVHNDMTIQCARQVCFDRGSSGFCVNSAGF